MGVLCLLVYCGMELCVCWCIMGWSFVFAGVLRDEVLGLLVYCSSFVISGVLCEGVL